MYTSRYCSEFLFSMLELNVFFSVICPGNTLPEITITADIIYIISRITTPLSIVVIWLAFKRIRCPDLRLNKMCNLRACERTYLDERTCVCSSTLNQHQCQRFQEFSKEQIAHNYGKLADMRNGTIQTSRYAICSDSARGRSTLCLQISDQSHTSPVLAENSQSKIQKRE